MSELSRDRIRELQLKLGTPATGIKYDLMKKLAEITATDVMMDKEYTSDFNVWADRMCRTYDWELQPALNEIWKMAESIEIMMHYNPSLRQFTPQADPKFVALCQEQRSPEVDKTETVLPQEKEKSELSRKFDSKQLIERLRSLSEKWRSSLKRSIPLFISSTLIICLIFMILLFFWPTLWRYDTIRDEHGATTIIRTHRIINRAEQLTKGGWVDVKILMKNEQEAREIRRKLDRDNEPKLLDDGIRRQITGRGAFTSPTFWEGEIYNGSQSRITELTIVLKTKTLSQHYRVKVIIPGGSANSVSFMVDRSLYIDNKGENPEWSIFNVYGRYEGLDILIY